MTDLPERPAMHYGEPGPLTPYGRVPPALIRDDPMPVPHPDTERAEHAEAELSEERARISEALTLYPAEIDRLSEKAKQLESDLAHCRSAGESYKRRTERAEAALARVRALHHRYDTSEGEYCEECAFVWPCRTIAALDGDTDA